MVGRAASGVVALVAAAPLCRAVGITSEWRRARHIGMAIAAVDLVGVVVAVAAKEPRAQRRAAVINASMDVMGAAALAVATQELTVVSVGCRLLRARFSYSVQARGYEVPGNSRRSGNPEGADLVEFPSSVPAVSWRARRCCRWDVEAPRLGPKS